MPLKTVDDVLEAARKRKLQVNNCFQLEDGKWSANFRTKRVKDPTRSKVTTTFYAIVKAKTMYEALLGAYKAAKKATS